MRRPANGGRPLTPSEQLKVLSRVWRNDRDGYVFLPWINGDSATKAQRRKNYHEGRAFEWPRERAAILAHLQAHQSDDLYFCPNLFNGKRRQEELVYAEMALYADLDAVDPRKLHVDRRPTIAWESSPGRFQGVWLLSGMREGATWAGRENQRLTYELGADLSGWDATQLLRVPGKPNYKHDYRKLNGGNPVPGVLLWDNGPRYSWDDFDDLPEVGVVGGDEFDLMDEEFLAGIDRHKVWSRVRMRCSPAVRRYMAARRADEVDGADRSDVLWQIERDLADAGCTLAEIVAVVRASAWNKFKDRNDELRRLKTEAAKAIAEGRDAGSALEVVDSPKPRTRTTIAQFFAEEIARPKWLVKDIWPEGSCGFIAGQPKTYKSWIALDLAVSLATGTPFLCDPRYPVVGRPRKVLYLQQEDSKSLVKDRLTTVIDGKSPPHHPLGYLRPGTGRERSTVWWVAPRPMSLFNEVRTGFVASDESWQNWLDEYVGEEGIEMVIIDTLFTSAGSLDLDRAQEVMTRMLRPLSAISDKHGCAVAIVHHNKKSSGGGGGGKSDDDAASSLSSRAGQDLLGSNAMHAWVETALYVRARRPVERLPGVTVEVRREGGQVEFLGVPGVELLVERESKLAEEIRLRVGIPKMARGDGEAVVAASETWAPQVAEGWGRETEGDGETRGHKKAGKTEEGSGGTRDRLRRRPGEMIVDQVAEMGVTDKRGKTAAEIAHVKDVSVRAVQKQLLVAEKEGWLRRDEEGRWYLTAQK